ncbi:MULTISPECIES: TSUP family transporter [unclassified Pseudomonas]|uniref:TSUP family transporter n=1 Tax=unclassified Pseudomonas TaxID=196821 RepID=UPI0025F00601|nr:MULTISPECIES: TSUP family transporter [unclassified Pseudomonas]
MDGLSLGTTVLSLCAVLVGATMQRLSGMGFALVASPLLVVSLGPHLGVLMANVLSALSSGLILAQTWRQVDLRRLIWLLIPALAVMPLGVWTLHVLSLGVLMLGIGIVLIGSLTMLQFGRSMLLLQGRTGAVLAGAASGFMNVTAGIGGPMIALYAASIRWPQSAFVGSVQVYFVFTNLVSLTTKGGPPLMPGYIAAGSVTLGIGLLLGSRLNRWVPVPTARLLTLGLAWVGAIATLVKGVFLLEGQ